MSVSSRLVRQVTCRGNRRRWSRATSPDTSIRARPWSDSPCCSPRVGAAPPAAWEPVSLSSLRAGAALSAAREPVSLLSDGAFPLPDSDSYSDYCTDSDSMQKGSTGTDSYGDSYANHRYFASLFEKLIVASIDPLLACLVIPTTGLYNNSHSFNK